MFCFRQQPFYSTELNSTSETKSCSCRAAVELKSSQLSTAVARRLKQALFKTLFKRWTMHACYPLYSAIGSLIQSRESDWSTGGYCYCPMFGQNLVTPGARWKSKMVVGPYVKNYKFSLIWVHPRRRRISGSLRTSLLLINHDRKIDRCLIDAQERNKISKLWNSDRK